MYLIRLDDASEYMDIQRWIQIEVLLDKYNIKPIVGIIPNNQDEEFVCKYEKYFGFWDKVQDWQKKGWEIALHGYTHVYLSNCSGINPMHNRSEFAGLSLEEQKMKINNGVKVFKEHEIEAKIFFAPSHTYDWNTIEALRAESNIRIISDTIANDIYKIEDFYFIPQQSGHVQRLPFKVVTFCYHPNNMTEQDFKIFSNFIEKNREEFCNFKELNFKDREFDLYDRILRKLYFLSRALRHILRGK